MKFEDKSNVGYRRILSAMEEVVEECAFRQVKPLWFSAQDFKRALDPGCRENKLIPVPPDVTNTNKRSPQIRYGPSIWLCNVNFSHCDTNIRFVATNVAPGLYNAAWHMFYHLGSASIDQVDRDLKIGPHIRCSIARPYSKDNFMDRTRVPTAQFQRSLDAIFAPNSHYFQEFFLPGQLDCVALSEWTEELGFPVRYFTIEHQVLVQECGDLAFLIKAQGGKVDGYLGFISVDLIPR